MSTPPKTNKLGGGFLLECLAKMGGGGVGRGAFYFKNKLKSCPKMSVSLCYNSYMII